MALSYDKDKKVKKRLETIDEDFIAIDEQVKSLEAIQSAKIDKIKNLFSGLATEVVSKSGTSEGLTATVASGVLTISKPTSTPDSPEGADVLVDLTNVISFGDLVLSFKYTDLVYTGSISNQILITLNSKTGAFKKTLAAISKANTNGTYSINISNDVRSYGLQDGFKIRLSSRDVFSVKVSDFVVGTSVVIDDNPLRGKTFLACGDSVGKGDGADNYSFFNMIASDNEMTLTKVCVNGATVAIREDSTDSILEQLRANSGYFDYIGVEGVFNDMFSAIPLGELSSGYEATLDETTFIGAMEALCKELVTTHYGQKFFFILGHKKPRTANQDTYWDAAISALQKWGIPYKDMRRESPLAAWTDAQGTALFKEAAGTHPLKSTHKKYYVPPVVTFMKTL